MTKKQLEVASRFIKAAENGNIAVMKLLLKNGAQCGDIDGDGMGSIHHAAAAGQDDVIEFLMEMGLEVDAVDEQKCTPLHWAARYRQSDTCRMLIERGADVSKRNAEGLPPLHFAAAGQNGEAGKDTSAVTEVLTVLMGAGAKIDAEDKSGLTALDRAVDAGSVECVRVLLKLGADVDRRNRKKEMPLHRAAAAGHADVVRLLVEQGATIDAKDRDGRTPLHHHMSAPRRSTSIVELLLKKGADPNHRNARGESVLDESQGRGDEEALAHLLKRHGATA